MSVSVRVADAIPASSGYAELARLIRRLDLQHRRPGLPGRTVLSLLLLEALNLHVSSIRALPKPGIRCPS